MLTLPLVIGSFVAGLGMFFAPCTLPIVPGYLAFIAGGASAGRGALLRNAIGFVIGFSVVFIVLGLFAAAIGHALGPWRAYVPQVAGAIIALFGLTMLGVRIPFISQERHMALPAFLQVGRPISSFVIGALFALGWSPCIGPLLGTILLVASTSSTAMQGGLLLGVFSLGLAVPFLLCAVLLERIEPVLARVGTLVRWGNVVGALVLIGIGLLMFFGKGGLLVEWGFALFGPAYEALLKFL